MSAFYKFEKDINKLCIQEELLVCLKDFNVTNSDEKRSLHKLNLLILLLIDAPLLNSKMQPQVDQVCLHICTLFGKYAMNWEQMFPHIYNSLIQFTKLITNNVSRN